MARMFSHVNCVGINGLIGIYPVLSDNKLTKLISNRTRRVGSFIPPTPLSSVFVSPQFKHLQTKLSDRNALVLLQLSNPTSNQIGHYTECTIKWVHCRVFRFWGRIYLARQISNRSRTFSIGFFGNRYTLFVFLRPVRRNAALIMGRFVLRR